MRTFVEKTGMLVTNVNPRKEGSGDGMVLASDVKVSFQAPRAIMDKLVPLGEGRWSEQWFSENGDVRLTQLHPIKFHQKLQEMQVLMYFGKKPTQFSPVVVTGIEMTPTSGGYVDMVCTIQVHPTPAQSGTLDSIVKEVVDMEIHALTGDLVEDAGTETANSEAE